MRYLSNGVERRPRAPCRGLFAGPSLLSQWGPGHGRELFQYPVILLFVPRELTVAVEGTPSFRDTDTAADLVAAQQLFLRGGWAYKALRDEQELISVSYPLLPKRRRNYVASSTTASAKRSPASAPLQLGDPQR